MLLVVELTDHSLVVAEEQFYLFCVSIDLLEFFCEVPDFLFSDYFVSGDVFHLEDFGCFLDVF